MQRASNYHAAGVAATNLAAALAYAARGWPVLPCNPQTKKPLTTHGFYDATTDVAQIEAWWQEWPCALIAVRTGPASGLWVLDVDVFPPEGIDGFATIAVLEKRYGALPDTLTSTTPRGGQHLFFKWCAGIRNDASNRLGKDLDVRGDGGYAILPPSMRWDRKTYSWRETCPAEPVEAPLWLIELLTTPAVEPVTGMSSAAAPNHGTGNGYARAAFEREIAAVAGAPVGQRNHTLNRASFSLHQLVGGGALSEAEVQDGLFDAATACGLVRDDGADTVRATIASGAAAGLQQPRTIPERTPSPTTITPETVAALMAGAADTPLKPGTGWRFHGEEEPTPTAWLIKSILPQTGAGLIAGQWGAFKTTVALDLAVSVMTGTPFAGRHAVRRSGGVAYFALEGIGGLHSRLDAIAHARGSTDPLPFAYRRDCPALTAPDALGKLVAMVNEIRDRFDVPVVLVFVDTVVTAAGYTKSGEDNDTAIAQRVMSVLSGLSQHTGVLAVGIDHFGKITDTGTRGSSAKEGHADTVLALLADREINGTVSNTRLAVRKQRDGMSGLELPFTPKTVEIGTDPDGDPITRVVIDWTATLEQPLSSKGWPKSLQLLRRILMTLLVDGRDIQPFLDGPTVRACDVELVRTEFHRQYPAEGDPRKKTEARRQAFNRALNKAQNDTLIMVREIGGTQFMWMAKNETRP